jgi:hypothetical protein
LRALLKTGEIKDKNSIIFWGIELLLLLQCSAQFFCRPCIFNGVKLSDRQFARFVKKQAK